MNHLFWNDWYFGWGWMLWLGFVILMFSGLGNWGYTYRAHQRFSGASDKDAAAILDERYARGEIQRDEYNQLKLDIFGAKKTGQ